MDTATRSAVRLAAVGAALAVAVTTAGVASAATSAAGPDWDCNAEVPSSVLYVQCWDQAGIAQIVGEWDADGDRLRITDQRDNDLDTAVWLSVEGNGTALFHSQNGEDTTHHNSYGEDKDMWMQVCTSDRSDAFCSPTYGFHT